jgi:hypothetical protein
MTSNIFYVVWSVSRDGVVIRAGIDKTFKYKKVAERHSAEQSVQYKDSNRDYCVMTPTEYDDAFAGKTRTVHNLMNGALVEESVTTSWHCSVESESYWCN